MLNNKVVVFDLDGTLGDFGILCKIWVTLQNEHQGRLPKKALFDLIDIFPEFLRPNIMTILNYLKIKKIDQKLKKVFIYTNNRGPKWWPLIIKDYFNNKIKYKLFDQVIGAFKVDGKIIEPCRTSNAKKHDDFIKCTMLNKQTEICFIDDQYHEEMINDHVYYIHIEPYMLKIPIEEVIQRYMLNETTFKRDTLYDMITTTNSNIQEISITEKDKLISKQLMKYLQRFLRVTYRTFKHRPGRRSSKRKTQRRNVTHDTTLDL